MYLYDRAGARPSHVDTGEIPHASTVPAHAGAI